MPEYDILIKIKGGSFSTYRDQAIKDILASHPAVAMKEMELSHLALPTGSAGDYFLSAKNFALNSHQLAELHTFYPIQHVTPVSQIIKDTSVKHPCTGAGCKQCPAPAVAPVVAEAKSEAATTPAKTVAAPVVEHAQGIAGPASNDEIYKQAAGAAR